MSFEHVTITKKANVYYDGKVSSRSIVTATGEHKSLGFMLAGEYHFNTEAAEIMEVLAGACRVRLDGCQAWDDYQAGQSFAVSAHSGFDIQVSQYLDYICHFA
ncbi:MAG: pyrimidine/purine nucleoside phosphorylase [Mariprofundaceae bacterium]|nr:pyrimidine/purine nucleoside phosphorylase [Mariprofundaceae bacterium]